MLIKKLAVDRENRRGAPFSGARGLGLYPCICRY